MNNDESIKYYDTGVSDYLPIYNDFSSVSKVDYRGETYANWAGVGGSGLPKHYPGSYNGIYTLRIQDNYPDNNVWINLSVYIYGYFSSGKNVTNKYQLRLFVGTKFFKLTQVAGYSNEIIESNSNTPVEEVNYITELGTIQLNPTTTNPDHKPPNYYCTYACDFTTQVLHNAVDGFIDLGTIKKFSDNNSNSPTIYIAAINYYNGSTISHPIEVEALGLPIPEWWKNYLNYYPGSVFYKVESDADWYSCNRNDGNAG